MKNILIPIMMLVASTAFAQTESPSQNQETEVIETVSNMVIPEGTPIKAALKNEITGGKMQVGNQIELTLAEPIIINEQVVVAAGAKILGNVTDARASGALGKKGKLAFDIKFMYLESGQVVKLSGQSATNLKGSGAAVAATAVLLTPVGLLIPGKGAKFEAGTIFDAYVAEETVIK